MECKTHLFPLSFGNSILRMIDYYSPNLFGNNNCLEEFSSAVTDVRHISKFLLVRNYASLAEQICFKCFLGLLAKIYCREKRKGTKFEDFKFERSLLSLRYGASSIVLLTLVIWTLFSTSIPLNFFASLLTHLLCLRRKNSS